MQREGPVLLGFCFCNNVGVLEYLHGYRVHICDYHYNKWVSYSMTVRFDSERKEDHYQHEEMMFKFARSWWKNEIEEWEKDNV